MDEPTSKLEAFPSEQNVFLIINRQMIPLEKQLTRIGRQMDNDIVFHEAFVSKFHAEICLEDSKFILQDRDSTGGTFVNGKKIDRCVLNSGDLLSIGTIQIMFVGNNPGLMDRAWGTTHKFNENK